MVGGGGLRGTARDDVILLTSEVKSYRFACTPRLTTLRALRAVAR